MISLPNPYSKMKQNQEQYDSHNQEDCEHDDYMTAEDYDRRQYERDGWNESRYDRRY